MPHSLFLGSGIVQPRVREYDVAVGNISADDYLDSDSIEKYQPSLAAIKHTLNYCIADITLSLFIFALFVNSAILIVSGATLSGTPGAEDADLFSIHKLLSEHLSKAAGTIFALALLFSGESAGVVVTLAGRKFLSLLVRKLRNNT
jgi:metal iron transporter